jgi:hypothetical protein
MNTVLSTHVDEHHQQHPPSSRKTASSLRRVTLPDRVALHLGLALIVWSRRPHPPVERQLSSDLHARNERARERAERERKWELATYLSQARR